MSVGYYHNLLSDAGRIRAFKRAIEAAVRPGDTVLEIGTGLGTYAFFAARAGAECVWGVDGNPIIHVAETLVTVNDLSDRVRCIRGWVPDVNLPGPVDVIVFEDFAARLLDTRTYRTLRSAIQKYLKPGGRMVPDQATVFAAPLSSPEVRSRLFPLDGVKDSFDIDWRPSYDYMRNAPSQHWLPSEAVVGEPLPIYTVRFPKLPPPDEMAADLAWELTPGTAVHGLAVWFDIELRTGDRVSNAPAEKSGPWGQMALPFDPSVVVDESGRFSARVSTDASTDEAPGWLRWEGRSGTSSAQGHEFAAQPASLADLFPEDRPGDEGAA